MITLHTPATGYPELEAKLAFGLARIGLECSENITITPQPAFYQVTIDASEDEANEALVTLATRSLGGEHQYFGQPGIQPRWAPNYPPEPEEVRGLLAACTACSPVERTGLGDMMCGHGQIAEWGGSKGFILVASASVGKPARRDRPQARDNLRLCTLCGTLVMLATHNFVFQTSIGDRDAKRAVMTPIPSGRLRTPELVEMQSAQKLTPEQIARSDIPAVTVPLAFLARFPHAAKLLSETECLLHTVIFDPSARDRVVATQFASVRDVARFVDASPFNAATVERLISPAQPVVDPLMQLARLLNEGGPRARRRLATSFARGYVSGADPANPRLLYPVTARYIAEELLMIPAEIMRNEAIASVASALRHFVIERNYGFVDNVRNARYDSHDLERTLTQMLRQMQVHRVAKKQGAWLPDDAQVADVITLASKSEDDFENVKLALTLLALSRWHGREEEPEEPSVVADIAEEVEE
ncbi:MAG: hypothetical protein AB7Y46_01875 [Armatimonadota bacterium]